MAKAGPPGQSKILSQVGNLSVTGLPAAAPQGYPAKAAMPRATPATAIRPYRTGLSNRGRASSAIPTIPTIRWK